MRAHRLCDRRPSHGKSEGGPPRFHLRGLRRRCCPGARPAGPHRAGRLGGQCMGRSHRHPHRSHHTVAAEHPYDHRHSRKGLQPAGEMDQGWPLVELYRFAGANDFIIKQLSDSILSAESVAAQPNQAAIIMESFRSADRSGMLHAMRSMMLRRNSIEHLLQRHCSCTGDGGPRRRDGLAS